jgi:AraC-like DNA-binding protein
MDALSEVLRLARFTAGVTLDATARAPWCVAIPASTSIARGHLILEGECELRVGSDEPVVLKAGQLALVPHRHAHLIGSEIALPSEPLSALLRTPVAGELMPVSLGGRGPATRWISLAFSCERHLADPLLACLPSVVKVDLNGSPPLEWLENALGLTLSGGDAPPVGDAAKRDRLAELVLIEALGHYVEALPPGGVGWVAGLNDRFVGRALSLVHGRPSEPWTVERLGRQVGLSRSALAERFSEVMGEPIFAFLTRWRLQLAAEMLLTTARPIESVAHDSGYESAGAFSHAFKRVFGKPPSVWRKKNRKRAP